VTCAFCGTAIAEGATRCASCGAALVDANAPTRAPGVVPSDPGNERTTGAGVAPTPHRLGNRYELLQILGRGGMGVVYRARDHELAEDVALKLLPPLVGADDREVQRLKREIVTARKISHPNVIRIHDFGSSGTETFIAMELLTGGSLAEKIAKGPIPIADALKIGVSIAEGLNAVHEKEIVHRDVKPLNVLFDARGVAKLSDFGLARLTSTPSSTVGFTGTPQYMSPEGADGRETDARSDVYALGVTLFETFTGRRPFESTSLVELANLHAKKDPTRPRSLRPEIPPEVEAVIMRCMQKDPAKRFRSAAEIADALAAVGDLERRPSRELRAFAGSPVARGRMLGLLGAGIAVLGTLAIVVHGFRPIRAASTPAPAPSPSRAAAAAATATLAIALAPTATPVAPAPSPAAPRATPIAKATHAKPAPPTPAATQVAAVEQGTIEIVVKAGTIDVAIDGQPRVHVAQHVALPVAAAAHDVTIYTAAGDKLHEETVVVPVGKVCAFTFDGAPDDLYGKRLFVCGS